METLRQVTAILRRLLILFSLVEMLAFIPLIFLVDSFNFNMTGGNMNEITGFFATQGSYGLRSNGTQCGIVEKKSTCDVTCV